MADRPHITSGAAAGTESTSGFSVPLPAHSSVAADLELERLKSANQELQRQLEIHRATAAAASSSSPANGAPAKPASETHSSIEGLETLILRVGPDHKIAYINTSMARYLNAPKESMVGQEVAILRRFFNKDMLDAFALPSDSSSSTQTARDDIGREFEVKVSKREGHVDILMQDISEHERYRDFVQKYIAVDLDRMSEEEARSFRFPERRYMTVSFIDLRGFTAISEAQTPEEVRSTLNAYLEEVIRPVEKNEAWVDKIVGDGVMSLFGAPRYFKDHAWRAIATACDQIENIRGLQERFKAEGKIMPAAGVSIHTADMVLGNMGSSSRQCYTVLGAGVNLAARLGGAARGMEVLLTESTLTSFLENLPAGWSTRESRSLMEENLEGITGGKTEGVQPLPEEQRGKVISVGPGDLAGDSLPAFRFRYLYLLRVKGVKNALPVVAVERPRGETVAVPMRAEVVNAEHAERIFGKYRLTTMLGRGGMGEVWQARDSFNNALAIKILLAGESATESQIRRFRREAEIMSRLSHRNIVRIYEVGEVDRVPFLSMELVPGVSLGDILRHTGRRSGSGSSISRTGSIDTEISVLVKEVSTASRGGLVPVQGPEAPGENYYILPLQQTLSIVSQICDGIQHAHEHGVLHRDLKPSNVMIRPEGEPAVMDFGLAKLETGKTDVSLSLSGQVVGTLDYMAPEQASSSKDVTERADVYSLGALLYQMVTGRKHFQSTGNILNDARVLQDHEPIAPRKLNRSIDTDLETIVLKALRPAPKDRYASVMQLGEDIKRYREGDPIFARPQTIVYRVRKKLEKYPVVAALIVALLMTLIVGISWMWSEYREMWGDWVAAYQSDFTSPDMKRDDFEFLDAQRVPWTRPPVIDAKGLELRAGSQWVWLKKIALPRDSRLALDVTFDAPEHPGDYMDGFDLVLNARPESMAGSQVVPPGYSATFGNSLGQLNVLSKNPYQQPPNQLHNAVVTIEPDRTYHLMLERRDDTLKFYIDGKEVVDLTDVTPLMGPELERLGFRSRSRLTAHVSKVEAYRLTLPKKSSPLIAADALIDAAFHDQWDEPTRLRLVGNAIHTYRNIASDYRGQVDGKRATLRAFAAANRWRRDDENLIKAIRADAALQGDDREFRVSFAELEAVRAFLMKDYQEGFRQLEQTRTLDPKSEVALTILQEINDPLPPGTAQDLLRYLGKINQLGSLDVNSVGLTGINELERAPLVMLNLNWNHIESLNALQGMPLTTLGLRGNNVTTLDPLTRSPLTRLDMARNKITSLAPIAGKKLTELDASWNALTSLAPLQGARLEILNIGYTGASDLSPLAGMPLIRLQAPYDGIESLAPLKGMPLTVAGLSGNKISDLSPLAGMPLRMLDVSENPVTSLAPLAGLQLRKLNAGGTAITTMGPFLDDPPDAFGFDADGIPDAELQTAADRWTRGDVKGAIDADRLAGIEDSRKNSPDNARSLEKSRLANLQRLGRNAAVLLACRHGDISGLKAQGAKLGGSTYLFIPKLMTWDAAHAFAQKCGAHLAEIDSEETNNFLETIGARGQEPWIGYTMKDGKATADSARPVTFQRFPDIVASDNLGHEGHATWSKSQGWNLLYLPQERRPVILQW